MKSKALPLLGLLLILVGLSWGGWVWFVERIEVPVGQSLMLRYKGPLLFGERSPAQPGQYAEDNEIGVRARLAGPGRHFYNPLYWERTMVKDQIIRPGYVGLVVSKLGKDLPEGEYLVDGNLDETEYKGVLRKVFTPGRYRYNPYGYEFKIIQTDMIQKDNQVKYAGWVSVPTGYVGVVTNLAANPLTGAKKGIQSEVLPPGLYPVNPKEQQIDIVEIGYREKTISWDKKIAPDGNVAVDEAGEPMIDETSKGIVFPSSDGFDIRLDFTAVWGIMPDAAPEIISTFGNVDAVEDKVVIPQIESICRNTGSSYPAEELLVGEGRQEFQLATTEAFSNVLEGKEITLLYGLVRQVYIPIEVRKPKQESFIAEENTLTRIQETETTTKEAELREAERKVELEAEKVKVETTKLVAQALAEGQKQVGEIEAETEDRVAKIQKEVEETRAMTKRLVAAIDKEVADFEAQAEVVLGRAESEGEQEIAESKATEFKLAVEAFGSGEAYQNWAFANALPDDVNLQFIYSGEGTLWTDLKNISPTLPIQARK